MSLPIPLDFNVELLTTFQVFHAKCPVAVLETWSSDNLFFELLETMVELTWWCGRYCTYSSSAEKDADVCFAWQQMHVVNSFLDDLLHRDAHVLRVTVGSAYSCWISGVEHLLGRLPSRDRSEQISGNLKKRNCQELMEIYINLSVLFWFDLNLIGTKLTITVPSYQENPQSRQSNLVNPTRRGRKRTRSELSDAHPQILYMGFNDWSSQGVVLLQSCHPHLSQVFPRTRCSPSSSFVLEVWSSDVESVLWIMSRFKSLT